MKNKTILIIALLSMIVLNGFVIKAEERPIYVGDIIELDIDNTYYSLSDIELAFAEFEIIEIEDLDNIYRLKVRSFEVGEHLVTLGDTGLKIVIESLINEDSADIKQGNMEVYKSGLVLPWTGFKYIALGIFILSLIVFVFISIKNRPRKALTNYESFSKSLDALDQSSDDYIYELNVLFKSYLSKQFKCNYYNFTVTELLSSIESKAEVVEAYPLMKTWLHKCESYKYSKDKANQEAKSLLAKELKAMINSIEKQSEVSV